MSFNIIFSPLTVIRLKLRISQLSNACYIPPHLMLLYSTTKVYSDMTGWRNKRRHPLLGNGTVNTQ
jgi:hypothetical protein